MTAVGRQLDTTVEIVTPENIAFRYRVAGPFRRLPAYLIDTAIRVAAILAVWLAMALTLGIAHMPHTGVGITLAAWFVISWFYGGLFETFWNGQTPGKWALGIRVVSVDGQPIHGWQAVLRNVLREADAQPYFPVLGFLPVPLFQAGLAAATLNDRFQRLGDLAAGTMVVVDRRQRLEGVVPLGDPRVAEMAARLPVDFHVDRTLGRALTTYVARRRMFTPARRHEIAMYLGEPLRRKFSLPVADPDLLLCGLYQRTFLTGKGPGKNGVK